MSNVDKRKYLPILLSTAILSVLPLVSFLTPINRELIIHEQNMFSILNFNILNPVFFYSNYLVLSLVIIIFWLNSKRGYSNFVMVSLIAVLVFPVLSFTPYLFDTINSLVPLQLIKRFTALNFLGKVIAAGLPIFLIGSLIDEKVLAKKTRRGHLHKARIGLIRPTAVLFVVLAIFNTGQVVKYYKTQASINSTGESLIAEIIESTEAVDFNNEIVVADEDLGYSLAALRNVDLVNSLFGHSSPSSNYLARSSCLSELLSSDRQARLLALGIIEPAYYMIDNRVAGQKALIGSKELIFIKGSDRYSLMKVDYTEVAESDASNSSCIEFSE